jgi:hypothetical protein
MQAIKKTPLVSKGIFALQLTQREAEGMKAEGLI